MPSGIPGSMTLGQQDLLPIRRDGEAERGDNDLLVLVFGGGHKPRSEAIDCMALRTVGTCSSQRSTPSSRVPCSTSSRLTPAAKDLSFHFFLILLTSTSAIFLLGLTSAVVVMRPVSSSTAKRAFSMSESR